MPATKSSSRIVAPSMKIHMLTNSAAAPRRVSFLIHASNYCVHASTQVWKINRGGSSRYTTNDPRYGQIAASSSKNDFACFVVVGNIGYLLRQSRTCHTWSTCSLAAGDSVLRMRLEGPLSAIITPRILAILLSASLPKIWSVSWAKRRVYRCSIRIVVRCVKTPISTYRGLVLIVIVRHSAQSGLIPIIMKRWL